MLPDNSPRGPESYQWITYLWVVGLSCLGGFVAFLRKVKEGHARAWNFVEFFGDLSTSAFAGIITFFLCSNANLSPMLTASLVGISGHMGSRAIFLMEAYFNKKFPQSVEPFEATPIPTAPPSNESKS